MKRYLFDSNTLNAFLEGLHGVRNRAQLLLARIYLRLQEPAAAMHTLDQAFDRATTSGRRDLYWDIWNEQARIRVLVLGDFREARGNDDPEAPSILAAIGSGRRGPSERAALVAYLRRAPAESIARRGWKRSWRNWIRSSVRVCSLI